MSKGDRKLLEDGECETRIGARWIRAYAIEKDECVWRIQCWRGQRRYVMDAILRPMNTRNEAAARIRACRRELARFMASLSEFA